MKFIGKCLTVLLLAVVAISTAQTNNDHANASGTSPATIYKDGNFIGASQNLEVGFYDLNALSIGNDSLSSIRVASGYRVTLYSNSNFNGSTKEFTADASSVDDMNDQTSSIKVELIGASHLPVTVYANSPYGGFEKEFGVGNHDMAELNASVGNDQISSLRVAPGYKLTLYKDSNYSGGSKVFTADAMQVDDFNDVASSLKVEAISPLDGTSVAVPGNAYSDSAKRQLLQAFAPRIWLAQGEDYFPSSVEYTLPYMDRYLNANSGKYELKTKETLSSPSTKLPYFVGDLANAPNYAFWVEQEYNNVDFVYFQFNPYNLGKTVNGTEVGNHVGDWERVTVRMAKFVYNNTAYVKPVQAFYGAHSFGTTYRWDEVIKVNGTHLVAYNADGSHGMWKDAGNHVYQDLGFTQLTDVTNQGTAWDTWNNLQAFQYYPLQATGNGLGNAWPSWLNKDYTNPSGGSVYRFGNPAQGSYFGQPMLDNGPTGPQEKLALTSDTALN
jgi:hypothetical protein